MTENEVTKILKGAYSLLLQCSVSFENVHDYKEASEEAIKALEEVQEYRKLGTVEEVREAVEKSKAKKCVKDSCPDHTHYKCPNCGKIQISEYKRGIRILGRITNNCDNCGQRLESEE